MSVDDSGAGPVWMLTFPLARERCRCSCGEGARLWAPVVVAGRRARLSRPRLAALDHSFGVPRVGVHVPSLPRRRVRSSRLRTATSGTRSVRRTIGGHGSGGISHRRDIVAAATASIAPIGTLPDVLDSLTGKKGVRVERATLPPRRLRPGTGGGIDSQRGYAPSMSRSARSDSARWLASWTVVSSAWSNTNVSR